jgi:large subunit ribosomal protein L4
MTMKPHALNLESAETKFGIKLIANGIGTQALHETVVAYQANRRAGTHATKTKATVNLSGAKPWRQKGTGRARAGYKSSPVWVGGGVVFGPQPRDYSKTTLAKVRKLALKKAISEAAKSGKLQSVASFALTAAKTKELATWIKSSGLPSSLLIVTKIKDDKAMLASRNIPKCSVIEARQVNAEDVLKHKQVVLVEDAMPVLAGRMK